MKLAYFRKSKHSLKRTIENLKIEANKLGLIIGGKIDLSGGRGSVFQIGNPDWFGNLMSVDSNLIGFLPTSVVVKQKDSDVLVGVATSSALKSLTKDPAVSQLATQVDGKLKQLVHSTASVEALKPNKVVLYATTSCPYCKMEASWLDEKKVAYEEKFVDLNQQEADEMVKKTGQMGVPVTQINYEDGDEEFIVGFDKGQLGSILNIVS